MPRRPPDRTPATRRGASRSAEPQGKQPGPRRWGGVARKGAARLTEGRASAAWREAAAEARRDAPEKWQPEQWIDEGELRDEAGGAVDRGGGAARSRRQRRGSARGDDPAARRAPGGDRGRSRARSTGSQQPGSESARAGNRLSDALGPKEAARAESRLREAGEAFRRERFEDARRILRPLAEQAPTVAEVRELYGLTLYRLGRWSQARRELEAFRALTDSTEQHPVLADSYRALGRHREVEELWDELRTASPGAALVAEGRIVAAGSLADRGQLDAAIRLLEPGVRRTKRARPHHLRMAYALADLYERVGDVPRARELFSLVAANEPEFVDVQERLRALR